jgi:transposase
MSGSAFLFIARNKKRAKVIWFDGSGFCLFQKHVIKGQFAAPWEQSHSGAIAMTTTQLALFLEGNALAFMGALSFEELQPKKMTTQIAPIR